eukprot:tig00000404_g371.t1
MPGDYTYIMAIGVILSFIDAYAIGANDVANSFANAVAAKTISLRTASVIAVFAEFLGAFLLGKATGETLKGGLVKPIRFADDQPILMLAMQCSLIGSSVFIMIATYFGMPVSTTHAIVGAIIGTGVAAFGGDAVNWGWDNKGVGQIVASWFISPAIAGVIAMAVFIITKYAVLERKNSFRFGLIQIPIFISVTLFVNLYFIMTKGMPKLDLVGSGMYTEGQIAGIAWAVAIGAGCIFGAGVIYWGKSTLDKKYVMGEHGRHVLNPDYVAAIQAKADEMKAKAAAKVEASAKVSPDLYSGDGGGVLKHGESEAMEGTIAQRAKGTSTFKDVIRNSFSKAKKAALRGVDVDVVSVGEDLAHLQSSVTEYDPKTEDLFKLCQVITCTFNSFAHGANDVANAMGPFSTIFVIWQAGSNYMCDGARDGRCWAVAKPVTEIEPWILAYGGSAIVIGLLTYGYNIMKSLGNHMTTVTPSRGYAMELGSSIAVIFASAMGWPVSTTQCITGATAAVGVVGAKDKAAIGQAVNWKLFARAVFSWMLTLPCAGMSAAFIFAYVGYSPAVWATNQKTVTFYETFDYDVNWAPI